MISGYAIEEVRVAEPHEPDPQGREGIHSSNPNPGSLGGQATNKSDARYSNCTREKAEGGCPWATKKDHQCEPIRL